jgi:uncharacterized phage protein (TIGR01671 family)
MASIRSRIGENMEDRYLFKAKRIDNGEWLVGYVVKYGYTGKEKYYIVPSYASDLYAIEIDPSTICQCTGLKDKNCKLIWENDIVKDLFSDACAQIKYGSYQSCFDSTKTEHVGFYVDWSGKCTKRYRKDLGYWINMVNAEVIGNIFDDPELIKEI